MGILQIGYSGFPENRLADILAGIKPKILGLFIAGY